MEWRDASKLKSSSGLSAGWPRGSAPADYSSDTSSWYYLTSVSIDTETERSTINVNWLCMKHERKAKRVKPRGLTARIGYAVRRVFLIDEMVELRECKKRAKRNRKI